MNKPIRMTYRGSHHMQVWFDEHRFQAYRQWRRKQGLPPEEPQLKSPGVSTWEVDTSSGNITAHDIVSVQPMKLPTGLVFYMDLK